MNRRGLFVSFVGVSLIGAACGGGGTAAPRPQSTASAIAVPTTAAPAACKPSGTKLEIAAKGVAFNKHCLAAPANTPFTIEFQVKPQKNLPPEEDPEGANSHNVSIKSPDSLKVFFAGKVLKALKSEASIDYHVPPLAAGTYLFKCEVHPMLMYGPFVVS
ncbi:MAG TPA: cupredoxin domain-containing protein [Actinomycetota bacterium]|jgi:hypothetical protein